MNNADWWSKKLGNPQPQVGRPDPSPSMPPSQLPMSMMPPFPDQGLPPLPGQNSKARSSSQTATCPDCGSSNYMAIENAKARCFDCGYPTEQSGSRFGSLAGASIQGSAKAAQGNSGTSGYNPQNIIGRIG